MKRATVKDTPSQNVNFANIIREHYRYQLECLETLDCALEGDFIVGNKRKENEEEIAFWNTTDEKSKDVTLKKMKLGSEIGASTTSLASTRIRSTSANTIAIAETESLAAHLNPEAASISGLLNEQKIDYSQHIEYLKTRIQEILTASDQELDTLVEMNTKLQQQVESIQLDARQSEEALKSEQSTLIKRANQAKEECKALEAKLTTLEAEKLDTLKNAKAELEQQRIHFEQEQLNAETKLAELSEKLENSYNLSQNQVDELLVQLSKSKEEYEQLKKEEEAKIKEIAFHYEAGIKNLECSLQVAKDELNSARNQIVKLEDAGEAQYKRLQTIEAELQQSKVQYEQANNTLCTLEQNHMQSLNELQSLESEKQALERKITGVTNERDEAVESNQTLSKEINEISSKHIKALEEITEQHQSIVEEMKAQLVKLNLEIIDLNKSSQVGQEMLAQAEKELENTQEELQEAKNTIHSQKGQLYSLQNSLKLKESELEANKVKQKLVEEEFQSSLNRAKSEFEAQKQQDCEKIQRLISQLSDVSRAAESLSKANQKKEEEYIAELANLRNEIESNRQASELDINKAKNLANQYKLEIEKVNKKIAMDQADHAKAIEALKQKYMKELAQKDDHFNSMDLKFQNELTFSKQQLELRTNEYEERVNKLTSEFESQLKLKDTTIAQMKTRLEESTKSNVALKKNISEIELRHSNDLKSYQHMLQSANQENESLIVNLKQDLKKALKDMEIARNHFELREKEYFSSLESKEAIYQRQADQAEKALLASQRLQQELDVTRQREQVISAEYQMLVSEREENQGSLNQISLECAMWKEKLNKLEVEFSRLNTTNISLVEQREQELQFLQKEHASAYKQVLQLSKEKANLIGHQNEKQKIRYVKQMQEENHNLKKTNTKLTQEREQQSKRIARLEEELDAYRAVKPTSSSMQPRMAPRSAMRPRTAASSVVRLNSNFETPNLDESAFWNSRHTENTP